MYKIGDLVKFKEQHASFEEKALFMVVTKVEKHFYTKNIIDENGYNKLVSTDKIVMLASNGETFNEPEQCLKTCAKNCKKVKKTLDNPTNF